MAYVFGTTLRVRGNLMPLAVDNTEFDHQRQKAAQSENAQLQRQRDAIARRGAAMGGGPGGALIKQEQLAADTSGQRLAQANEGIDMAQRAEGRRIREVQEGRDYQTSERLGSQGFSAEQSAIARKYGTGEREASQAFSQSERLGSQDFASTESAKQITAARDQQMAAIQAAAEQGQLTRDQATAAMAQAQKQFEQTFAEEQRVNIFNMEMAKKMAGEKDPLERLGGAITPKGLYDGVAGSAKKWGIG